MEPELKPDVLVVGAGAWGTALANVLARGGCCIYLWDKAEDVIAEMNLRRHHPNYCVDIPLEENVHPTLNIEDLKVHLVVLVPPFQSLRNAAKMLVEKKVDFMGVVSASKGIEKGSLLLAHEIISSFFPDKPFAQVSGPSFAQEVLQGSPTAITVGTKSAALASFLIRHLHAKFFRLYSTQDVIGVEVGGALKNVIAIAAGISDGLELGSSARSALIVRGMSEISKFGQARGAEKNTFMGLSGFGDLVLTCSDDLSRNRRFGIEIGAMEGSIDSILLEEHLVEGFHTAMALAESGEINFDNFPLIFEVISVLKNHRRPRESLERLLGRDPKCEDF